MCEQTALEVQRRGEQVVTVLAEAMWWCPTCRGVGSYIVAGEEFDCKTCRPMRDLLGLLSAEQRRVYGGKAG